MICELNVVSSSGTNVNDIVICIYEMKLTQDFQATLQTIR